MGAKLREYYQITWLASGMQTPLVTKDQLLTEVESALLHLRESNTLSMSINQKIMSERDFEKREAALKNYGFEGTVN